MKSIRYILPMLLVLSLTFSCGDKTQDHQGAFKINGTLKGFDNGVVTLVELAGNHDEIVLDATMLKGGKFELKGSEFTPKLAYIVYDNRYEIPIFLEEGEFHLTADTVGQIHHQGYIELRPKITGSKTNDIYLSYLNGLNKLYKKPELEGFEELSRHYEEALKQNDTLQLKKLESRIKDYFDERDAAIQKLQYDFVLKNNKSIVAPYIMLFEEGGLFDYRSSVKDFAPMFNALDKSLENTKYYQMCKQKIEAKKRVAIGAKAPEFALKTPTGKIVSLSDYKGKYVYLNFWAHWCRPCIDTFPDLKKIYATYNEMGLEIISISDDPDQTLWKEALKEHKLPWPQLMVSTINGNAKTVSENYNIEHLPTSFLIDRDGTILENKIDETLLAEMLKDSLLN